jgi:hypothetical protein
VRKYRVSMEQFLEDEDDVFCVYRKESGLEGLLRGWVYVSGWKTLDEAKKAISHDRKNPIHEE